MVKEQYRDRDTVYKVSAVHFTVANLEDTTRQAHLRIAAKHLYQQDSKRTPVLHGVLDRRMGTCTKDAKCTTCGKGLTDCVGHFGYVDLELPVFQCGYFAAVLNILYCICKSCSTLLLKPADKSELRNRIFRPGLTYLAKKGLKKLIVTRAKKCHTCPNCGAPNGVVKKCGMFKIAHDKYRHAKKTDTYKEFMTDFEEYTDSRYEALDPSVDILNPITVLNLFQNIAVDDIPFLMMGSDKFAGKPVDLILQSMPVPPICIRPSVISEIKAGTTEDDITMKISEICFLNEVLQKHRMNGGKIEMITEDWEFIQTQCALVINSEVSGLPPPQVGKKKVGRGFIQRLKGKQGRFRGNLSGKRVDFSGRSVISPDPNLTIQQVGIPVHMARTLTYPERVTPYNIAYLRELVKNGPDRHPGANFIVSKEGTVRKYLKYGDKSKIAAELKYGDTVERHISDGDIMLFNRQPSLHRLSIMCHLAKVVQGRTLRFNECVCAPYNADFDGDEMNIHLPQTEEARAEAYQLMANESNLVTPRNGELIIAATQDFLTGSYLMTWKDTFFTRSEACRIIGWAATDTTEWVELPRPCILKPMELWTGKQLVSVIFRPNRATPVKLNLRAKGKNYTGAAEELNEADTFIVVHNSELVAGQLDKSTLGSGGKANIFFVLLRDWGQKEACAAMYRLSRLTSNYLMNRGFSIGIGDVTLGLPLKAAKEKLVDGGFDRCYEMLRNPPDGLESCEGAVLKELSEIRDQAGKLCVRELHKRNTPLIMAMCGSKGSYINISQMITVVGQQAINGKRVGDGFIDRPLPHFYRFDQGPEARGFVANSFFNGLSPTEFFFHAMGGREGLVDTAVKTAETGYMQRRLVKALEDLCCAYDMTVRNSEGQVIQLCYGEDGLDPMYMEDKDKPVDFMRVYLSTQAQFTERKDAFLTSDEKTAHIKEMVECGKFTDDLVSCSLFEEEMRNFVLRTPFRSLQLVNFLGCCWKKYYMTRMEPGTAVGALAAQSIGEPGTQMTLKTFHFAGVASMNITLGVPRIKEIINAARNISTPIVTTYLKSKDSAKALSVKNYLQKTTVEKVADSLEAVMTQDDCYLVVHLNPKALLKHDLTPHAVSEALHKNLKINRHNGIRVDGDTLYISPNTSAKSSQYFTLQSLMLTVPDTTVKGIPAINRTILSVEQDGNYKLLAEGTNFLGVLATDGVDHKRTTTNNIFQIQQVLGIEAARTSIIREIQYTMESHGMSVDKRHLTLVADLMTCRGEVLGITRHGLAKMKESVLMLASFEKTADHLFEAAYHGQRDSIAGVSESIIMGIPTTLGTGSVGILEKPFPHQKLVMKELIFEGAHDN